MRMLHRSGERIKGVPVYAVAHSFFTCASIEDDLCCSSLIFYSPKLCVYTKRENIFKKKTYIFEHAHKFTFRLKHVLGFSFFYICILLRNFLRYSRTNCGSMHEVGIGIYELCAQFKMFLVSI